MINEPVHVICWMTALASIRRLSGPLINVIEHDYKDTFIEVHKNSRFISYTTSGDSIETVILDKIMLKTKDDAFDEKVYYFFTINLKQIALGLAAADRLVSKVIKNFIHNFGYMSMDVHIVKRLMKSSGEVEMSVLVVDAEFRK